VRGPPAASGDRGGSLAPIREHVVERLVERDRRLPAEFVADAAGRPVAVRETDKLVGSFATAAEVAAVRADLESWSGLVFEALEAGPVGAGSRP